jgi:hypothetical protein
MSGRSLTSDLKASIGAGTFGGVHMQKDLGPGMIALRKGDVGAAIAGFDDTLRRDPDNLAVRMMLGYAHVRAHDYGAALETFWSCLERDPALGSPFAPTEEELDDALAHALASWAAQVARRALSRDPLTPWFARYRARFRRHVTEVSAAERTLRS